MLNEENIIVFLSLARPTSLLTSAWTVEKPSIVDFNVTVAIPLLFVLAVVELKTPIGERFVNVTSVFATGAPLPSRTFACSVIDVFVWATK